MPDVTYRGKQTIGDEPWNTHSGSLQPRPRPTYEVKVAENERERAKILSVVEALIDTEVIGTVKDAKLCAALSALDGDEALLNEITFCLAVNVARKDIKWKEALGGSDREPAIKALHDELAAVTKNVLKQVHQGDPEYEVAVKLATSGRMLLDQKRNGVMKARCVKRGFEEDIAVTDGPNFNYYAHVAEVEAIRALILRPNRGTRRLAIKDVRTAFLQSIPYPDGKVKHLKVLNPLTKEWMYFIQYGPIYGENSAPVMWGEDTLAPFLVDKEGCNMVRGENHRCVYLHEEKDLAMCTYVDDFLLDGEEPDIVWFDVTIDGRFDCKPLEFLDIDCSIEYIGMEIIMTVDRIYISMESYIEKMVRDLEELGMVIPSRAVSIPLAKQINVDGDSPPISSKLKRILLTALGSIGWNCHTARVDVAHAFSRIGQHSAKPSEESYEAVVHCIAYLDQHRSLCLFQELHSVPETVEHEEHPQHGFKFYCDSDHAGNTEIQNKRRSQNGMIAMIGNGVVLWKSKASSIAFATPMIDEAHADYNSGAVEVYATANATYDIFDLCYLYQEAGMPFPVPFVLLMDNTTAEAFCNRTVQRSKLKYIDCRQEWCLMIRDKNIMVPEHVATLSNLSDLLTKILGPKDFTRLLNQLMVKYVKK